MYLRLAFASIILGGVLAFVMRPYHIVLFLCSIGLGAFIIGSIALGYVLYSAVFFKQPSSLLKEFWRQDSLRR